VRAEALASRGLARGEVVYFSVIDQEWPRVRSRLEALLARR
jgi:hypothetical protein